MNASGAEKTTVMRDTAPFTKGELLRALQQVLSRRSAPGLDGVRPGDILGWRARNALCRRLRGQLARGNYGFFASRRGRLDREGKSPRLHAISTMDDGVVLRAITNALEDVWVQLPQAVLGGRPGCSCMEGVSEVSRYIAGGETWALKFDVRGAFANAKFDQALSLLQRLTDRVDLIRLIRNWRATQGDRFQGLVEGAAVAPLLLAVLFGVELVPYLQEAADLVVVWLDDGLVLARDETTVIKAEKILHGRLAALGGLEAHPKKTGIFKLDPTSSRLSDLEFLGFSWSGWLLAPSVSAQQALLDDLDLLAEKQPKNMRERIRTWSSYFCRRESAMALHVLADLDSEVFARHGHLGITFPLLTNLAASSRAAVRGLPGPRAGPNRRKPGSSTWTERTTYKRLGK